MKYLPILLLSIIILSLTNCRKKNKLAQKGFQVSQTNDEIDKKHKGLAQDSLVLETRPSTVLMTKYPEHRLTTVFKVNYTKDKKSTFIGSSSSHYTYDEQKDLDGNNWSGNFMPGFNAIYGYNMVNVSHYNVSTKEEHTFFEKPVLIKTFYLPAFSDDSLNYEPIQRDYYMVTAFDEDTNKDGFINFKDLRRMYYFGLNANHKRALIPTNYNIIKSEYDSVNDYMYIFARLDENKNGQTEREEKIHIFWIDLKNPEVVEKMY